MKDELNNYNITNSDGTAPKVENEGKVSYVNDKNDYIRENVRYEGEVMRVAETADEENASSEMQSGNYSEEQMTDASSASSSASSAASTASSSVASASASVGGSLGALAGVVASSVVAAVIVVVVFVSTLTINLALLMAEMFSLTFEVQMSGAQEEDFETPIYIVLTGENDIYREQLLDPDNLMVVFDDLQPGTQYTVKVKNDEKIFFEGVYFTATEPADKGEIISRMDGTDVFVKVQNAKLNATEYYTLVAKDASGNIVYQIDGVEAFTEYHFVVQEPKNLYFYLSIGGKTYAMDSIEMPEYDLEHGVWTWENDNLTATLTFADKIGGEDLVLNAEVTRKITEPTCDKDGSTVYTAKVVYEGNTYTGKTTVVIESEGHDYEGTIGNDGHMTYTCSKCGDWYTDED